MKESRKPQDQAGNTREVQPQMKDASSGKSPKMADLDWGVEPSRQRVPPPSAQIPNGGKTVPAARGESEKRDGPAKAGRVAVASAPAEKATRTTNPGPGIDSLFSHALLEHDPAWGIQIPHIPGLYEDSDEEADDEQPTPRPSSPAQVPPPPPAKVSSISPAMMQAFGRSLGRGKGVAPPELRHEQAGSRPTPATPSAAVKAQPDAQSKQQVPARLPTHITPSQFGALGRQMFGDDSPLQSVSQPAQVQPAPQAISEAELFARLNSRKKQLALDRSTRRPMPA
jgi:hypothetical protein